MYKKAITYEDYLGTVRTEDFYFNFSKSELSAMQMSVDGGLNKKLEKMIQAKDNKAVYNQFTQLVLDSYGELSDDGRYHLKEDEHGNKLYKKFMQSPAYDALMDEICQNETTIAEFCNAIVPKQAAETKQPQDHLKPVQNDR